MPARNSKQWEQVPGKLKSGEYVDSRIYSDRGIFEEEINKIFKKVWTPVCHESELPDPYSFRTMTVAREPVMVVRGADNQIRAFLNVCPHRGNMIENRPSGSFEHGSPSGAPKHMTCMFHAWQFDPPSPDSAGIAYLPGSTTLLMSDSEVNEMNIYRGVNMFELGLTGSLLDTWDTTDYSGEPTGVAYNPDIHLFRYIE